MSAVLLFSRLGKVLVLVGAFGFPLMFAFDRLTPLDIPTKTFEDTIRISARPVVIAQPKAPAFLEFGDGSAPARVSNFNYIEPGTKKEAMLGLVPGTVVTVRRAVEQGNWGGAFEVWSVQLADQPLLTPQDISDAHESWRSDSRQVLLLLGVAGAALLLMGRLLRKGTSAA